MASNNVQQQQAQQQHYQTVQQSGQLHQQQGNSSAHHCKECGLYLNSAESLEVHLRYHKENLLNKWATQAATSAQHTAEETNNNTKHQIKREFIPNTISAAADSSDSNNMKKSPEYANRSTPETNSANNNNNAGFGHPPTPQSYHSASSPYQNPENSSFSPGFQNFQIKQERASPTQHFQQNFYSESFFNMDNSQNSNMGYNQQEYAVHKMGSQNSAFRYHPYQQQHYDRSAQAQVTSSSPAYPPQPTPSPSPKQCDKCGCVCESAAQLIEHLNVAHPPTPAPHAMSAYQNFMFGNTEIKVEEDAQSEILDLDSHKVHQVYSEEEKRQQQNGELAHNPHSVSAMLNQWPHPSQQHSQQNSPQQKMYVQDQRMYSMPEQKMYPNGMQEKMFQDKLFSPHPVPSDFMQNGVTTSSQENAMSQAPQTYRPFEMAPQATPPVISSTQVPVGPPQSAPPSSTKSANWKSNEARRPKTYNCTACNKWFTSSGHLKRHYNTTLHKNAVKSSGQPDPAALPISAHHHPARDQNNREDQSSNSPNDEPKEDPLSLSFERPPSIPGLLQQPPNGPYDRQPAPNIHHPSMGHAGLTNMPGSPPNGEAGPSATANMDSRGLLSLNTTHHHNNSNSPHGFIPPPMMPMENNQFQMYPNGAAPHVTQVITNNLSTTGEELIQQQQHQYGTATNRMVTMSEAQPLPSFAQFQAHRYGLILSYNGANANVGGTGPVTAPYSYYSDPYDTPESRALIFRQEDDYKLTVLTVPDPSMEGDPYSPPNNNNHLDLSATDGELKMELKYETPASPEKAHIKRDFEENSSPQISSTVNVKQTSLHKCFDCDKVFNKSCYLTQHNKTFHSGDKPFKCSRCGKRFSCENQYQEHHSKHAGEKPHKCDLCPKQFNHKTDLRRHMCLHTGQKPYACDTCGKGFIRKDHMLKHCDTHIRRPHSKLSSVR